MHPAVKAASLILGLIVLASLGYAGWLFSNDQGDRALPLVISSIVCAAMIVLIASRGASPKE